MLNVSKLQTPNQSGKWKNIEGTADINEADYIIIQDYTERDVENFISSNNILDRCLYFSREVPGGGPIKRYENMRSFSYLDESSYLYTKWAYPSSMKAGVNVSYDSLKILKPIEKLNKMICIQSNKRILQGHILRLMFIKQFCLKRSQNIDITGSITKDQEFFQFMNRVDLKNDDKFETLSNYKYSLAFDNGKYRNYFGTQFTDSLLTWTIPIYWGCPNINEFFPDGSYLSFDVMDEAEIERISLMINDESFFESNLEAVSSARDLILDKYNMWNVIWEAINLGETRWK
jgi:hypothetical protein